MSVGAGRSLPGGGGRHWSTMNQVHLVGGLNEEQRRKAVERAAIKEAQELARSRSYAKNWVQRMQENALCAKFMTN